MAAVGGAGVADNAGLGAGTEAGEGHGASLTRASAARPPASTDAGASRCWGMVKGAMGAENITMPGADEEEDEEVAVLTAPPLRGVRQSGWPRR